MSLYATRAWTAIRAIGTLAGAASLMFPLALGGQERAAWIVRLGNDTLQVEQVTRTGTRVEGEILSRTPSVRRLTWVATLDDMGGVRRFEFIPRNADGSGVSRGVQSVLLEFGADSITRIARWADSVQTRKLPAAGAVMPMLGWSAGLYELATRQLRTARRDSAAVRFLAATASQLPNPLSIRMWSDSAQLDYFGRPMLLRLDREGRIQSVDGSRTTLKISATRSSAVDLPALATAFAAREQAAGAFGAASPRDTARATIGRASVWVDYGRPALRGRNVWVNGVLGDTIWRTGANAATQLSTDTDLEIGGVRVPAGKYTLWTWARSDGTYHLIVNRQTGQWGTAYDPQQDLARIPLVRSSVKDPVERFTIALTPEGASGSLRMAWGNTELTVPIRSP